MPKSPIQIEELIIKYARGQRLNRQEMAELEQWQSRSEEHQALPEKFKDPVWLHDNLRRLGNVPSDRMWDFIRDRIAVDIQQESRRTPGHLRRVRQWTSYAAAVIVLMVGWPIVQYIFSGHKGSEIPVPEITKAELVMKGSDNHQVLLTLGDGRVLPLDHIPNGKVAELGGLILTKTDSDRLEYSLRPGSQETAINSRITTGKTSPFHLVFPDGSTAQLSYSSTLSTSFHEGQREVALTGEALFETAKNSHQPFIVSTKKALVEVLGTQFDISSYADEPHDAISLLSGAVKVVHRGESKVLRPMQKVLAGEGRLELRPLKDTANVLAWTSMDPYFYFDNTDLNTVVRRIARWYQVSIYNPDNVTGAPITGVFRQKETLEVTLGMIDRAEKGYAFLKRKGDRIEISAAVASR